ncbi:dihydrolipoamide acetyltransferase family protein, partial [Rhodoferax fermentans]
TPTTPADLLPLPPGEGRGEGGPTASRPLAAPAVRRRAVELGLDLAQIKPSHDAGRITHADLEQPATRSKKDSDLAIQNKGYTPLEAIKTIPVIGLRRKIAQKMQEAKRRIPHFSYIEEIDVTELEHLRAQLNQQHAATRGHLTLLPLLVRALVLALREFPEVNARYDDDAGVLSQHAALHLGLATQSEGGLMVPVIRHAEALDLWACAREISRLAQAARSGQATREELTGSTLTLTSLGALGGIASTPIINHPEVAIVGTNRIVERPVILGGAVVARKMMNLSSSFDHRVVDGHTAARFIQRVRSYLECPATLFVD